VNRIRLASALAGFAMALLSVAFGSRLLGWVAILLLGLSAVLRLVLRRREDHLRRQSDM
jgi:hypothetical protein